MFSSHVRGEGGNLMVSPSLKRHAYIPPFRGKGEGERERGRGRGRGREREREGEGKGGNSIAVRKTFHVSVDDIVHIGWAMDILGKGPFPPSPLPLPPFHLNLGRG